MRPSPTDLLANFSKIDCYEFYDTNTRSIIEELENKKIKIDHHALILTRIDEILAEDSPRRSKFIKLLIDKQSVDALESLIEYANINIQSGNKFIATNQYFQNNIVELSKLLGFYSSTEELTQNSKFDEVKRLRPRYPVREYQQQCTDPCRQIRIHKLGRF